MMMAMPDVQGTSIGARRQLPPFDPPTLWARQSVQIESDEVHPVVPLQHAARIKGHLTFSKASQGTLDSSVTRRLDINQIPADGESVGPLPFFVAPDWTFITYGAPPGLYYLTVSGLPSPWRISEIRSGARTYTEAPLVLGTTDVDVEIDLTDIGSPKRGRIAGRALTPAGQPSDATVVVWASPRPDEDMTIVASTMRHLATSLDGTFIFTDLSLRDYSLVAIDPRLGTLSAPEFAKRFGSRATVVRVDDNSTQQLELRTIIAR
jgi:hypothetical protein